MMLLANKKARKTAAKGTAVVVGTALVGVGAWWLLSREKNNLPDPIDTTTDYQIAPQTTTAPQVQYIADSNYSQRNEEIEKARNELLLKLELKNQQQVQIEQLEQKLLELDKQLAELQPQLAEWERDIPIAENLLNIKKNSLKQAIDSYNSQLNLVNKIQQDLSFLEIQLNQIYERNEWWNPAWYIEKGNKEVELQNKRTEYERENYTLNALRLPDKINAENDYNKAQQTLSDVYARVAKFKTERINPVESEKTVVNQTLAMYRVAFDAINSEIENLKKITGGV